MLRTIVALLAIGLASVGWLQAARQEPSNPSPASQQRALLNRYCVTCHNERLKTAGLLLDKMDVEQLRAAALKCKADAEAKTAETEKLAQELIKALSTDNADKRKELNAQMEKLRKSEDALYAQLKAYIEKLKEKGGDMSGLEP